MLHLELFMSPAKVRWNTYIGAGLLLVAALVGMVTVSGYGMSWDEESQRWIGRMTYNYVFFGDDALFRFTDRDYGVALDSQ